MASRAEKKDLQIVAKASEKMNAQPKIILVLEYGTGKMSMEILELKKWIVKEPIDYISVVENISADSSILS